MKLLITLLVLGILVLGIGIIYQYEDGEDGEDIQRVFYGPVNIGYNETHFRLYGEHIKEKVSEVIR